MVEHAQKQGKQRSRISSHEAQEILAHLLQSLEIFLKASASKKRSPKPVNLSLAQALPSDILVKIGETHLSDSRVITPLCSCIVMQVTWTQPPTLLALVMILFRFVLSHQPVHNISLKDALGDIQQSHSVHLHAFAIEK